jgi:glycerophosphoryl diester phosphodiesterase
MKIIAISLIMITNSYAKTLIAHRGVHQTYNREGLDNFTCTATRINPVEHKLIENTLESIEAAFNYGADMVELDIHPTTEESGIDNIVVFHDWTLDCRTEARCEGGCETNKNSLEFIQSLDIGFGYTADNGETYPFRDLSRYRAPSFRDVLDLLKNHPDKELLINVKGNKARTVDSFIRIINEYDETVRSRLLYPYFFSGLRLNELKTLKVQDQINQKDKGCLLKYLKTGWYGHFPKECHYKKIFIPIRETLERVIGKPGKYVKFTSALWGWPERFIDLAHKYGTKVYASQVDSVEEFNEMNKLNLDGIMTNRIEVIGPHISNMK